MPGRDHFDLLAPYYDRFIRVPPVERLVDLAGLPVSGKLLDAGGGTGRIAQALNGQAGSVIVADGSLRMLAQARLKGDLELVGAFSEGLPFANHTFERIIMIDALHHVQDQAETARELVRVLKPGGRLVVQEPNIHQFSVKIIAAIEKITLMRSHFLAPQRIAALFENSGVDTKIVLDGYDVYIILQKLS